jgi:ABC-type Na+ efflux pump permease subunit
LKWVRIIYLKEMMEALRDRRTLFLMIGVPILLYPIIFLMMGALAESYLADLATRTIKVAVWGEAPPGLEDMLTEDDELPVEIVNVDAGESSDVCAAARQLLIDEKVEVIVRFDPEILCEESEEDAASDEGAAPLGRFEILFDGANLFSGKSQDDMLELLEQYSSDALRNHLTRAGLDPELSEPFGIASVNLAGEERMSGHYAGRVLPSIVIMMVLLGAFYPAIDLTAGEKERSTLETLISAPIHASEIVAGKYLAVVTIALIASGANLASMGLTLSRMASQIADDGGSMALSVGGALTVFLLIVDDSECSLLLRGHVGQCVFGEKLQGSSESPDSHVPRHDTSRDDGAHAGSRTERRHSLRAGDQYSLGHQRDPDGGARYRRRFCRDVGQHGLRGHGADGCGPPVPNRASSILGGQTVARMAGLGESEAVGGRASPSHSGGSSALAQRRPTVFCRNPRNALLRGHGAPGEGCDLGSIDHRMGAIAGGRGCRCMAVAAG